MTSEPRYLVAASAVAVAILAIGSWADHDQPASDAGKSMRDAATKTVELAQSRRPVEKAPPVADTVPGDGTWIIGKEIRRGRYRTVGGLSCYWERLVGHPSGRWVMVDSGFGWVPQMVALGRDDVAFVSQGCAPWVMVP